MPNTRHRHSSLPFSWSCPELKVGLDIHLCACVCWIVCVPLSDCVCAFVGLYVCICRPVCVPLSRLYDYMCASVGLYVCLSLIGCMHNGRGLLMKRVVYMALHPSKCLT